MTPGTWEFELTQPYWLAGLLALPVLVYYFYWSLSDFPTWQRIASLVIRSVIIGLFVASLAGLAVLLPTTEQCLLVAVDRSLSVGGESKEKVEKLLDELKASQGGNQVIFLPFAAAPGRPTKDRPDLTPIDPLAIPAGANAPAANVAKEAAPDAAKAPASETASPPLDPHGTNLAAAIDAAAGAMPPTHVPHILLLTDGNTTAGDAVKSALQCGFPVSTFVLSTRTEPEVQVSSVSVPAQVREGEPFYVDVLIDTNHDDEGLIEVYRGDHKVLSERKELKSGENRFLFRQSVTGERLANYTVRVSGLKQDTLVDNNSESGLVFTAGKPRVLLVESDQKQAQQLTWALEQEDVQVHVRPPEGMPDSLADMQNYELVIVSNVPATSLSQRQMDVARTYVQDLGGGFMMLGGDQSFGLGGYYKSVLEEILPVRSDFEKEKEKPSLGMVLVIDRSGSMSGEKLEMAKTAAASAVELLSQSDKVCVLAFDSESYTIVEMQPAGDKARIIDEIARIDEGGGTSMYPPMVEANEILQSTAAKLKHVIILTDGVSEPGDFNGITEQMAAARITVSTVAIGEGCDEETLQEIARIGNGRYYFTDDPNSIPQIFAKETMTASKSALDEQPFVPQVVRATRVLQDIEFDAAPFLLGYVLTRPKPTSELILVSEKGDPVLAWWRYGLGMTAAFTSDAKSRWAAEWVSWPEFSRFWAQVVRHIMRKSESKGVAVQVAKTGRTATVTVDSIDPAGQFVNQAETSMSIIDPQLGNRTVPLLQTAPGRYVGSFETPTTGAYHLELSQTKNGQPVFQQSRGLTVGYSDELRLRPANDELLKSIASLTSGVFNPTATDLWKESGRTAHRPVPLWPWLISLAALLFVLDVALRRIDFGLMVSRPGELFGIVAPRAQG